MLEAEKAHRAHAIVKQVIVEQVIADLKNGPLAHLPSGHFWANSAWLVCATIAFNLTRAAGVLASSFHARASTGTIRAQLSTVPARLARSAQPLVLHLPTAWPWRAAWEQMPTPRQQPTAANLTHPPVHQDPTGDTDTTGPPATSPRPHQPAPEITPTPRSTKQRRWIRARGCTDGSAFSWLGQHRQPPMCARRRRHPAAASGSGAPRERMTR